jgi:hypothetical protein
MTGWRLLVAAAVLALPALSPSFAMGQAAGDSVVGSGFVAGDQFEVSIHAGPSGENPTGFLRATGTVTFEAVPTCLHVSGNLAAAGYRIVSSPTQPLGSGFFAVAQDNGPAVGGQPVDVLLHFSYPTTPPTECPDPNSFVGGQFPIPLVSGDLTVTDVPALPTSSQQCSNGGWRAFGVFKNQGDCVSFVATGGKNPPAGT